MWINKQTREIIKKVSNWYIQEGVIVATFKDENGIYEILKETEVEEKYVDYTTE